MAAARYHHGNLREALTHAAVEAVREQGPEGLAVRELARRVGVSHNAAYRHFADRDALVDVVADHAMRGLVAAIHRRESVIEATEPVARARRRLQAIGTAYVDFALAEPGLFRLLFTAYPDPPDGKAREDDPYGLLNAALDGLVAVGWLDPAHRPGAAVTCWAAVHGFATLSVEGPLRGLAQDERAAALQVLLDTLDAAHGPARQAAEVAPTPAREP